MELFHNIKALFTSEKPFSSEPEYLTQLPAPIEHEYPLRTKQENELFRKLQKKGTQILLYGAGGVGKTHMARKLFYRLRPYYKYMAWVEYGSDIRKALTPPPVGQEREEERFIRIMKQLEECAEDTILFIDDAKENAMDDVLLAQLTGFPMTILVTSRCAEISPYQTVELAPLRPRERIELFFASYPWGKSKQLLPTVDTLVRKLEGNVFAILLFARFVGREKELTKLVEKTEKGALKDWIALLINKAGLTQEEEKLLRCLSYLPSGKIARKIAESFGFGEEVIESLIDKHWILRSEGSENLFLHDLIREHFSRAQIDVEVRDRFIKGAFGEDYTTGYGPSWTPEQKKQWLEFQTVALKMMEDLQEKEAENIAMMRNTVGVEILDFGNYLQALEYLKKALSIREKILPSEHPDLAWSYNNVGGAYGKLGDWEKALEYSKKALSIREKVLRSEHPDLALSYNNVGGAYGKLGEWEKALEYLKKALSIWEKSLPSEHPDLATSYNNVGSAYGELGDWEKALEYLKKALSIREKVLPPEHPDLALSYHNVGYAHGELGDREKALDYFKKALSILEEILPPEHPDLAHYYNNVGSAYGKLGDREKELEYFKKALSIREKRLPPEHPDLATSYNNVGCAYGELGDWEKALEYLKKALSILEKSLPPEHPDLATSYNNVGGVYGNLGDWEKALEYSKKALSISEKSLPPEHPVLALSYNIVGSAYGKLGDREKALEWLYKAKVHADSHLYENHPLHKTIRKNLAEQKALLEQEQNSPKN